MGFNTLSVDIECLGTNGHFPNAEKDPVIVIGCVLGNTAKTTPRWKSFSIGSYPLDVPDPDPMCNNRGDNIMCVDEKTMLLAFVKYLISEDPDFIVGYNHREFDFPYMLKRAQICDIEKEFLEITRVRNSKARIDRRPQDTPRNKALYKKCCVCEKALDQNASALTGNATIENAFLRVHGNDEAMTTCKPYTDLPSYEGRCFHRAHNRCVQHSFDPEVDPCKTCENLKYDHMISIKVSHSYHTFHTTNDFIIRVVSFMISCLISRHERTTNLVHSRR